MSRLFSNFRLAQMEFPNRIVVAPMCQHMAEHGIATDWHLIHWGSLALSGAGLVMIEATGVEMEGRISPNCLSLDSDASEKAMGRMLEVARRYGDSRFGLQLSHAGRKGSTVTGSSGRQALTAAEGAWPTVGPSAIAVAEGWPVPKAADREDLKRIREAFASAARRALAIDMDVIELHAAHGYLLHQFLSPVSNQRSDAYGGSPEARMRYPLEIFDAVREVWPSERPLGVRITGRDWYPGGLEPEDAVQFATALQERGCDFVDVTTGAIRLDARPPQIHPGYQAEYARKVKAETGIPTFAVGMINTAELAEELLAAGDADFICLARGFLDDPRWPWHAAEALGDTIAYPPAYDRCHPRLWPATETAIRNRKLA
ncbi:NADH:flavin oxidoreductase/NADH oxidase [Sinisalibacter aestuarii]|uniref:NADH-dependent flavin oxidoreductase n=1 Tax=Sinisalibacter aestuarii TaxID=2949426 RepID=A0ABQ5LPX5_9RHOB|nr:NADH:flavin oxidoreductase/NADH oxidase [Sinisalibacter aestuarii]GKY87049.1 NADH-dependent flavin oxidoreductase [Sinisalibacter aestuarii]